MNYEIFLFAVIVTMGVIILLGKYVIKAKAEYQDTLSEEPRYLAQLPENLQPWYFEFSRSLFLVFLIIFLLRGFIYEPFRVPSGSMLPSLEVGDFILVNKFTYGIRLPIISKKIINIKKPKRGDIMVFRYPGDNKTHYVKRLIGLPGDEITYQQKQLYINGKKISVTYVNEYTYPKSVTTDHTVSRYEQTIPSAGSEPDTDFSILLESYSATMFSNGVKTRDGQPFVVPQGHYFVLGDNRDHSADSRFWGFVPEKNVVGKASFIWFHWDWSNHNWSDIFSGIDFSRVGVAK